MDTYQVSITINLNNDILCNRIIKNDYCENIKINYDINNFKNLNDKTDIVIFDGLNDEISSFTSNSKTKFILITDDTIIIEKYKNILYDVIPTDFQDFLLNKKIKSYIDLVCLEKLNQNYNITFDALMNSLDSLVWVKNNDGTFIKVNDMYCKTVERFRDNIIGQIHPKISDINLNDNESYKIDEQTDSYVLKNLKSIVYNEKAVYGNKMRFLKTKKTPVIDFDGKLLGLLGVAIDETDIINLHNELEIVINNMPFAVSILDLNKRMIAVNELYLKLLNATKEEIIGLKCDEVLNKYSNIVNLDTDRHGNKCISITKKGKADVFSFTRNEIFDVFGEKTGYLNIYRDISEENYYEKKLEYLVERDDLTKLFNRRILNDNSINSISKSDYSTKAAIMLDIDDFKIYNDTFGHIAGDKILSSIGVLLNEKSQDENVVSIRYGGEEFVIFLIDKDINYVKFFTDCLLQDVRKIDISNDVLNAPKITCSIGVYFSDNSIETDWSIIAKADKAMYFSKKSGKNRINYYN